MSAADPATLRPPNRSDYAWIVAEHGRAYSRDYGWDASFEGLVAGLVSDFVARHDPARERCWIADLGRGPVGSVFCTRHDDETAKLRMLILAPEARGHGLGALLVDTCMSFARVVGYRRMTLWTNDILIPARKLYAARGWTLTRSERVTQFGQEMGSETWDVVL